MSQQQATLFLFSLPFSDSTESENTLSLQRCQDKVLKHVWQNKEQKEKIFPSRRAKPSINAAWWLFLWLLLFLFARKRCVGQLLCAFHLLLSHLKWWFMGEVKNNTSPSLKKSTFKKFCCGQNKTNRLFKIYIYVSYCFCHLPDFHRTKMLTWWPRSYTWYQIFFSLAS